MPDPAELPDPFPNRGSKAYTLLNALLMGQRVDTIWCMVEINLQTPNARVSELRKVGWPIRSIHVPHPKLTDEKIVQYTLDRIFRRWYLDENDGKVHPLLYQSQDGRGKFKITKGATSVDHTNPDPSDRPTGRPGDPHESEPGFSDTASDTQSPGGEDRTQPRKGSPPSQSKRAQRRGRLRQRTSRRRGGTGEDA